jgi:hypothetical protein
MFAVQVSEFWLNGFLSSSLCMFQSIELAPNLTRSKLNIVGCVSYEYSQRPNRHRLCRILLRRDPEPLKSEGARRADTATQHLHADARTRRLR